MAEGETGRTDVGGGELEGESGVGAGDPRITSTEEPPTVLPDDEPDHRSGLETGDDGGGEKFGDAPE